MNCDFVEIKRVSETHRIVQCRRCLAMLRVPLSSEDRIFMLCKESPIANETSLPPELPGFRLAELIHALGMGPKNGCNCEAMIAAMNLWGVAGCREHRAEIIEHLAKAYHTATLGQKARAAGNTLLHGGPWTIGGLVDEAIRRAASSPACS
jgi:hypothetical protein